MYQSSSMRRLILIATRRSIPSREEDVVIVGRRMDTVIGTMICATIAVFIPVAAGIFIGVQLFEPRRRKYYAPVTTYIPIRRNIEWINSAKYLQ